MGAVSDDEFVRLRLTLSYDGTQFHGWAQQDGLRTVEGDVTRALSTVMRCEAKLTVAGRTDAGVHAREQVAHVDVPRASWERLSQRDEDRYTREEVDDVRGRRLATQLNGLLSHGYSRLQRSHQLEVPRGQSDVLVHAVCVVNEEFDARFSATGRSYCYRLVDRSHRSPLRRSDVLWVDVDRLDLDAMNLAAEQLLGEHDFIAYCRPREGATTIRTLRLLTFVLSGDVIECRVEADAFCHSMVRSLVGACLEVGSGRREISWPRELLDGRNRHGGAAPIAPAHGLTLERVDYPPREEWAAQSQRARRVRTLGEGCCGE